MITFRQLRNATFIAEIVTSKKAIPPHPPRSLVTPTIMQWEVDLGVEDFGLNESMTAPFLFNLVL
jgi:hypothetical protein